MIGCYREFQVLPDTLCLIVLSVIYPDDIFCNGLMSRLHRNSTGGTGTHSAGKLTKTEVGGKEDS
jgi:hypothetical protein